MSFHQPIHLYNQFPYHYIKHLFCFGDSNTHNLPSKDMFKGFPGGAVVKNTPANAGDTASSPGLGRSHMPQSN